MDLVALELYWAAQHLFQMIVALAAWLTVLVTTAMALVYNRAEKMLRFSDQESGSDEDDRSGSTA